MNSWTFTEGRKMLELTVDDIAQVSAGEHKLADDVLEFGGVGAFVGSFAGPAGAAVGGLIGAGVGVVDYFV
jgi:hypothetical protein